MNHRTAILVLGGLAFLAGPLHGCNSPPPAEPVAAGKAPVSAPKAPAAKPIAGEPPAAKEPAPKAPAPKTDCKALEKELMTFSNVHGKVVGFAWGQTLAEAKLGQEKMMAVFQSAQQLQQKLSADPAISKRLGTYGIELLIQAGCGPAGSHPPATGEQRCQKIEENLDAFKKLMLEVIDSGFKDALKENKLGKQMGKLNKLFSELLPKSRQKHEAELQKVQSDLLKRTGCQKD